VIAAIHFSTPSLDSFIMTKSALTTLVIAKDKPKDLAYFPISEFSMVNLPKPA
jgi:hypothetical protein